MLRTTRIVLTATALFISSAVHAQSYTPKGPIEQKYMADGPWATSYTATSVPCDRENKLCDIWYPTNLGANGFRHPIIAWANGSGQVPLVYQYWLRHLASWGFVVVGSRDTSSSKGETVIDAANYIITQGNTAGSLFYGKVDGSKVGAAGHSQGGCTVATLFTQQTGLFSVYYSAHPAPTFLSYGLCGFRKRNFRNGQVGAIFYMQGEQDGGAGDTQNNYYEPTPSTATKAYGDLAQADHDDIMGNPGCVNSNCTTGVYGYLGYPTAWFMWKLQGASDGPAAFSSSNGEFMLQTPDWAVNLTNVP